jgi:16S rRNA processing protein RimM
LAVGERVCVAQFGAAHGVRGEMKLRTFTDDPLAFTEYGPLETEDRKRTIEFESIRPAKDHFVVRVIGIDDRNAAEALRNVRLFVPRDRLPPVEDDDTYYHADLVGLDAVAPDGAALGTVLAIHNFGAGDIVEIKPPQGATLLLPFTETVVPKIDLKARRMTIVLPQEIIARDDEDA